MTKEIRVYGLPEASLRERLAGLLEMPFVAVTLLYNEGHGTIALTGEEAALEAATAHVAECLGSYVYSYEGESLATCVVNRLATLQLTVATAESCTGGLIAAALTDVPGASQVFGTGVVSYSNQCKQRLLTVSGDTIAAMGAVSAETAGQMARGVRQTGDAAIGVSVTGEAGPNPAEDLPVGTVFVALADKKRTWLEELHLDGADRAAIRRQAADSVLWLLWRYLSAYPMVMAGGESNHIAQKRTIPHTKGSGQPRFLSLVLPWKGDSRRRLIVKCLAWLMALAMLVGLLVTAYQYFIQPQRNQELQQSLGNLYWENPTDLTDKPDDDAEYPAGMLPMFRGLYDMNRDIGGWLRIPNTGIDYPVMNYADGYYDNHSFLKEYSIYGQPYFGSPSTPAACLVYGQNTGDEQMFSELLSYRRVAFLQEHSVIECNTIYASKTWQVFAVVVLNDYAPEEFALPTEEFAGEEDYMAYITQVQRRSLFLSDVVFDGQEELLVLSTNASQDYDFPGARLAVFARLMKEDTPSLTYQVNYEAKMPDAMYKEEPTTNKKEESTTSTKVEDTTTATDDKTTTTDDGVTKPTKPTSEDSDSTTHTATTDNGTDSTTTDTTGDGTTATTKETTTNTTDKPTTSKTTASGTTESTKTTPSTSGTTVTAPTTGTGSTTPTGATGSATAPSDGTTDTTDTGTSDNTTDSTSATDVSGQSTDNSTNTTAQPTVPTAEPGDDLMGEDTYADIRH